MEPALTDRSWPPAAAHTANSTEPALISVRPFNACMCRQNCPLFTVCRGLEPTGKLAVVLERCIVDVLKFVSLYILWNLGFTLAFYTMQVRCLCMILSA